MLRQYRNFAIALTLFFVAGFSMVSLIAARAKGPRAIQSPTFAKR
jgi:hypothetical protein